MRRADREVADFDGMLSIIKACDVMRLAMVDENGQPYIIPLNFGWEAQGDTLTLYFHSADEGHKLDILRQHPSVCFEMDTDHRLTAAEKPCGYSFGYKSIIGRGMVVFLVTHDDKAIGLQAIMRHAGRPDAIFSSSDTQRVCVARINVEQMTGKSHA
jgi:nitroimidazol reductase NimA-like FMN-containing flavoprotein (pyridoxamine 5'-phosphate oxidase superfamily)